MRIGLFTDTYLPYISGLVTSVDMLKKSLEKLGHTVYIVTANLESFHYDYDKKNRILKIPGVPTGIYDSRLTGIYPIKAIKIIRSWDLDIIHSQTEFGIGTFARILAKQYNIPIVHTYHTMYEDYVHYITHGYFNRSSKKIVEYLTVFYCDKTISELVVPTKKAYELFKQKYRVNRNVYIVPTGIDIEKFYKENHPKFNSTQKRKEVGLDPKDFVILFVGRIASEKNIELLLTSMRSLVGISNKIKLLIVGDGPDLENYKKYTEKNHRENQVVFAGKVQWDKIPDYYLMSDCFVTASHTETQGLTVIEAMAASLPVVVIEDESFEGTVIDNLNGLVFRNKREYKKCILNLFQDKELRKRLGHQARISAETHSSRYFAEQILEVYRIAIQNKPKHKIPIVEKMHQIFKEKDKEEKEKENE